MHIYLGTSSNCCATIIMKFAALFIVIYVGWHSLAFSFNENDRQNIYEKRKLGSRHNSHHKKAKIAIDHSFDHSYGMTLPNFAYDFSEFFINAMITRVTNSTDMYLQVMLLGHQTIYEDFPFEAINTDDKYFHAWKQVSDHWKAEHDANAWSVQKMKRSQYYCLLHHPHIQENHTASTLPHYTSQPVQWLRIHHHPRKQSSGLHRYYDVFRCKIKSSHLLYSTQSDQSNMKQLNKPLYVDLCIELLPIVPLVVVIAWKLTIKILWLVSMFHFIHVSSDSL